MSEALRCGACGGTVVYDVGRTGAVCMFCGSMSMRAAVNEDPLPTPDAAIPLEIGGGRAEMAYRQWARRSWWYPAQLRNVAIELTAMYLPAWRFRSDLETHFTGLERASTRSGKRPISGVELDGFDHMVPASRGLEADELAGLMPFDERRATPWRPDSGHLPWEPPAVSERAARIVAHREMAERHRQRIANGRGLLDCRVSPLPVDHDVRLYMLPIYIGVFRYRNRPWRFVINAQTGEVVGKAPIDPIKVAMVITAVVLIILALAVIASHRA